MSSLRALTLYQPWCWSMTALPPPERKEVENRPRPCWRSLLGKQIALHAGLTWDAKGAAILEQLGLRPPTREQCVAGAIVALVTIERQVTAAIELPEHQRRYFFGPYGYVCRDLIALPEPVKERGMQGFWPVSAEVEAAIRAQIGGAP